MASVSLSRSIQAGRIESSEARAQRRPRAQAHSPARHRRNQAVEFAKRYGWKNDPSKARFAALGEWPHARPDAVEKTTSAESASIVAAAEVGSVCRMHRVFHCGAMSFVATPWRVWYSALRLDSHAPPLLVPVTLESDAISSRGA
jgi:hypothetical protein